MVGRTLDYMTQPRRVGQGRQTGQVAVTVAVAVAVADAEDTHGQAWSSSRCCSSYLQNFSCVVTIQSPTNIWQRQLIQ